MKGTIGQSKVSRRNFLVGAGTLLAAPYVLKGKALAAGQVVVRTPGGAYDDIMRKFVYDPFTAETGIQVVPVAATVSKLLAMFKANNVEIDLIDTGEGPLITLSRMGALAPIEYDKWTWSRPEDVAPEYRRPDTVANFVYSSVLAFNTETFPGDNHPKNWVDFWDAEKFPGPRMLTDMAAGSPSLEFALLAAGVKKEDLYPIDIDRAFKMLTELRPNIRKFWDSGAVSAQLLSDKEVVMGCIWNGRLQTIIEKGAPLNYVWDGNMIQVQALGIFKDSPNRAAAQRLVDFMTQPDVQAKYVAALRYGPTNLKAFDHISADLLEMMPGGPKSRELGFVQNTEWWEDNRDKVNRVWSRWILG
ncbi:MAG: ABC transporter substrate-binding protein [Pseudomonadota bacterium]